MVIFFILDPQKLFIKTIKRWSKSLWALCKAMFLVALKDF